MQRPADPLRLTLPLCCCLAFGGPLCAQDFPLLHEAGASLGATNGSAVLAWPLASPTSDAEWGERVALAHDLAVHTNGLPQGALAYEVRSAARGALPPPDPRWVLRPDRQFQTEHALFSAVLAGDLSLEGAFAVEIPGPRGPRPLRGTILALAYCEPGEDGQTAILGRVRATRGALVGQDRVVFRDAFEGEGVTADVVYHITRYALCQDVVVRGRLPGPEDYGLVEEACLTVVTEFFDAAAPEPVDWPDGRDVLLRWGRMGMVRGQAFTLGDLPGERVDVHKAWLQTEGRHLLLESVPHPRVRKSLESLPELKPLPERDGFPQGGGSPGSHADWGIAAHRPYDPAADPSRGAAASRAISWGWPALEEPALVLDFILTLPPPSLNIDFGFGAPKTGPAAAGLSAQDVWNTYDILGDGTLTDLQWSDAYQWASGHNSYAAVSLWNARGRWGFPAPIDPMYDTYHYPWWGSISGAIAGLPPGLYDVYLYGHGPAENANTVFTLQGVTKSTAAAGTYWNTANWQEGHQ